MIKNQALVARMKRELSMLEESPPQGISAWPREDKITELEASITGASGTPYEQGIFKLEISLSDRYPFEPPKVRFITPIYHPNIDTGGRICLDTLVMPPKGAWTPSLNISTVLTSIQSLISEPNPDDGLMTDITAEYKHNRAKFTETARQWTRKYALADAPSDPKTETETKTETKSSPKSEENESDSEEETSKKRKEVKEKPTNNNKKPKNYRFVFLFATLCTKKFNCVLFEFNDFQIILVKNSAASSSVIERHKLSRK